MLRLGSVDENSTSGKISEKYSPEKIIDWLRLGQIVTSSYSKDYLSLLADKDIKLLVFTADNELEFDCLGNFE